MGDTKTARTVVVPARLAEMVQGLPINLVEVVDEKKKRKIIQDTTFSDEPERRAGGGGR